MTEQNKEEERRAELMDNLPCGAGIYEYEKGKLRCRYLNKRYWELVGRSSYDFEMKSFFDVVQLEDRVYLLRVIQEGILHDGNMECDIHIKDGNDKYIPFHLNGNVVKREIGYLTIYVTYTPIPESEVSFREMLPVALETMMSSSTDLAFIKDRTLTYVCATKAFAQMVGFSDEREVIGKTDFDLFVRDIAVKFREDDQKLMKNGKSLIDIVERLPDKDGAPRYSSTSKYLLKDTNGNIVGLYGVGRDITENKEAFERLKLLTDSIPGGLATYEVSPDRVRTLYLSDGVYALSGYEKGDYNLGELDPTSLIIEEDLPMMRKQILELVEHGTPIDCTYRIRQKEGDCKWINLKGAEAERSGSRVNINAVLFDVTEAHIAELKLEAMERENRKRYEQELQLRRELIKNSIMYYQANLTTWVIEEYHAKFSDTEEMKSHNTLDESLYQHILQNVALEDKETVSRTILPDALLEAYDRGETTVSLTYRRKVPNQGYRWVDTSVSIMARPNTSEIIAFLHSRDVDMERKKQLAIETIMDEDIEAVIIMQAEDGQAYIAHMRDNFFNLDLQTTFDFEQEYRRKFALLIVEEDQEDFEDFFDLERLKQVLQDEKVTQYTYRVKEGDIIRRKTSKAYYLDDMKKEIVFARRDVTSPYEEEQRQKNELREAMEEANRANHAKSEFLSQMSHDIRTPLNAVLAFSDREMLEDATKEQLREYLEKVNLSGDYLLGIINDVLDMSKIEQKKVVLKPTPYSLDEFVSTINNVIMEWSRNKNIEFVVDTSESVKTGIMTDRVRFNQIFINLLSNAVKFTPKGGKVEFILKQHSDEGSEVTRQQFIVRDNGIGMSPEFLPHAFESFNQEYRQDTSEKSQGTGLGLSIVKELVNMMNGTIDVQSELGKGSTFIVELPLELVDVEAQSIEEEEQHYECLKGARILLGEDNMINTEIAVALLEKRGCIVECAENGKETVERFRDSEDGYYDLILLDIRMPVMDGLTATREIRKMHKQEAETIPIIALTADAFYEDERVAYDAGMNDYLSKPIDPHQLYRLCSKYIEQKIHQQN